MEDLIVSLVWVGCFVIFKRFLIVDEILQIVNIIIRMDVVLMKKVLRCIGQCNRSIQLEIIQSEDEELLEIIEGC